MAHSELVSNGHHSEEVLNDIRNLRPCCAACNFDMNKHNMYDYLEICGWIRALFVSSVGEATQNGSTTIRFQQLGYLMKKPFRASSVFIIGPVKDDMKPSPMLAYSVNTEIAST